MQTAFDVQNNPVVMTGLFFYQNAFETARTLRSISVSPKVRKIYIDLHLSFPSQSGY